MISRRSLVWAALALPLSCFAANPEPLLTLSPAAPETFGESVLGQKKNVTVNENGFVFNGADSFLFFKTPEIPGSLTIALRAKIDRLPEEKFLFALRRGFHHSVGCEKDGRIVLEIWGADKKERLQVRSETKMEPGKFYDIAAVFDRENGQESLRLYVNGKPEGEGWLVTPSFPYAPELLLGNGNPFGDGKWAFPLAGTLADVRLYRGIPGEFAVKPLDAEARLAAATVSSGDPARLHRFFERAEKGEKLTVGVIGGSITEGASSQNWRKRYANVLVDRLQKQFPKAEFSLVNAGIGATGSNYAAMRAERDLLSKAPDLVVQEFAVNDGNTEDWAESYEGLARQILNSPKQPALILLFMMREEGERNAQEWESKVGRHYKLPMLSVRDALWPDMKSGELPWRVFSPDAIHPNQRGHVFTGELLAAFLDRAREGYRKDKAPSAVPDLPPPLISDVFEHCKLFDREDLQPIANRGWTFREVKPAKHSGWESAEPGSVFEFKVEGERIFVSWWCFRGAMGMASVTVDDGKPVVLDGWTSATWGGYRNTCAVAPGLKPGVHTVKIELLDKKHPESTGHQFRIQGIGSAGAAR